jgi:hypothetical protein
MSKISHFLRFTGRHPRQMFQENTAADRGTTAAATTPASMKRSIVTIGRRPGASGSNSSRRSRKCADTTAPTISGRSATDITGNSAQITWNTNEAATSRVEYGLTTSYGSLTPFDATLVTAHSDTLNSLANMRMKAKVLRAFLRPNPPDMSMEALRKFVTSTPQGPHKLATVLMAETNKLLAMDRYERRALSRRKFAIPTEFSRLQ